MEARQVIGAVAAALLGLGGAACGSDDGDATGSAGGTENGKSPRVQQIEATYDEFSKAMASQDGDAACALMTKQAQAAFVKFAQQASHKSGLDCGKVLTSTFRPYYRYDKNRILKVDFRGDTAVALATVPGRGHGKDFIRFVRVGDDWKINWGVK